MGIDTEETLATHIRGCELHEEPGPLRHPFPAHLANVLEIL